MKVDRISTLATLLAVVAIASANAAHGQTESPPTVPAEASVESQLPAETVAPVSDATPIPTRNMLSIVDRKSVV